MKQNVPIKEIMSTDLITIDKYAKYSDIKKIFLKHNFHHLPVVEADRIIGIISLSDLLRVSFSEKFAPSSEDQDAVLDHSISTASLMKPQVTLKDTATIKDAAHVLRKNKYHSIAIIHGKDTLVGIVTSHDLIEYLIEQY